MKFDLNSWSLVLPHGRCHAVPDMLGRLHDSQQSHHVGRPSEALHCGSGGFAPTVATMQGGRGTHMSAALFLPKAGIVDDIASQKDNHAALK
jgi:hypothetical protein